MEHVYLSKAEIDRAYRLGCITVEEVKELLEALARHQKAVLERETNC